MSGHVITTNIWIVQEVLLEFINSIIVCIYFIIISCIKHKEIGHFHQFKEFIYLYIIIMPLLNRWANTFNEYFYCKLYKTAYMAILSYLKVFVCERQREIRSWRCTWRSVSIQMWRPLKVAMETCSFAWSDDFHTGSLAQEKDRFPYCGVTECCSNHGLIEPDLNFKLSEITWYWRPLNPQLALFTRVMERLGGLYYGMFYNGPLNGTTTWDKHLTKNTFDQLSGSLDINIVLTVIFIFSDIEQNRIDFTRQVSTNIVLFFKYWTSATVLVFRVLALIRRPSSRVGG